MNGSIMKIAGEEALRQNIVKTKEYVQQHSGGGHTIITASSLPMAGQPNLQFEGVHVENVGQAGQGKTVIKPQFHVCATEAEWNQMTDAEKNDPLIYWVRPWANSDAFATDRTPVGTVISVAGTYDSSLHKFPTDDYLVCNGASPVYINQYPKLAEYFEQAYGTKFYFNVGQLDPQDGTFAIPDWSADFPENGILCIKAQISSTAITFAEIDDTGIYAGEDKVPSCARVAEIESESLSISSAKKSSGAILTMFGGAGVQIDSSRICVIIPLPFIAQNNNYDVIVTECTLIGIASIDVSKVSVDSKTQTFIRFMIQHSGTAKDSYVAQIGIRITLS